MNQYLYDAIYKRKSIRKYKNESVSDEILSSIEEKIKNIKPLFNDCHLQMHIVRDGEKLDTQMKGLLKKITKVKAPHYLVVTSHESDHYLINAGYMVEKLVLEMTALNIGTCWQGGPVKDEVIQKFLGLPKAQKMVILVSFGYTNADHKTEYKRKDLEDLIIGKQDEEWKLILEAARLSPSSINSQPWRFIFNKNKIHVYKKPPKNFIMKKLIGDLNKIDIGIALSHIEIASLKVGKRIKFIHEDLKSIDNMEYMISIIEEK